MYELRFTDDAERDLERLDRQVQRRILKRLEWLAEHADQVRHEQMTGPLAGLFNFRVGDYRVHYDLLHADRVILVHLVKHRREAYD